MLQNVIEANRERDLWLKDNADNLNHCIFIPRGWCDEIPANPLDEEDGPEIYCYAATLLIPNSPVETLWVEIARLQTMEETTQARAQKLHPALQDHLNEIDEKPTKAAYTFEVDQTCPHCKKDLNRPDAVLVQAHAGQFTACVNDNGVLEECDTPHDLCLNQRSPTLTCTSCRGVLSFDAVEEK